MNKELTPLKAWEEVEDAMREWTEGYEENFDIIKSALKDLEEYKKCIDLKEANYVSTHKIVAVEEDTYKDLVKNSQTLEIIKKNFNITEQRQVQHKNLWNLTQEQFDLLREVLKK